MKRIMERCGGVIDLKEHPEVLDDIVDEVTICIGSDHDPVQPVPAAPGPPFDISWMDSWVAHRIFSDKIAEAEARDRELAAVLRGMADLRFNSRLDEIRKVVGGLAEPPDGGTPEPGPPAPAGPSRFEPPDGGTPEPGPPAPAGPSRFEPPDGGTPEPGPPPDPAPAGPARFEPPDGGTPEPGVPAPTGPHGDDFGSFAENPWILYWFISLKTPMLLEVIDLHISRRLESMRQ